jgi:hypothetical protein
MVHPVRHRIVDLKMSIEGFAAVRAVDRVESIMT